MTDKERNKSWSTNNYDYLEGKRAVFKIHTGREMRTTNQDDLDLLTQIIEKQQYTENEIRILGRQRIRNNKF